MAMQECKRAILGKALEDLVARARSGKEPCRIGLMASGGEHSYAEFLAAASAAMSVDPALTVVGVGPKPSGILPQGMDWIETGCEGPELASGMENALAQGRIHGAVALHYPFPLGVTTVGRVLTPGTGKPLFMASCTGMSAAHRQEAMLRNAILGVAVAKALGITCPSVGVLNLDAAPQVLRALNRMAEKGYPLNLGQSVRGDGGSLLRGNDLLCGAVDVCVADTLTGNVLMKVFSAFTSGGSYETSGWGYGPSVGEGWDKVVSIVSRASGAPVIANALAYTAAAVRGRLPAVVAEEIRLAKAAGMDDELAAFSKAAAAPRDEVQAPPAVPTDEEIHGIDVLDSRTGRPLPVERKHLRRSRDGLHRPGRQTGRFKPRQGPRRADRVRLPVKNAVPPGKSPVPGIRSLSSNARYAMIIVDKETFEAEVQQSSMPCVVDLWGPQCGPCLALMPEVEKLAEAYEGKLKFCKLNVAENRRLVISLRVMAVPTILFYKGGECVARISGDAVSIEAIKAEADKLV